MSDSYNDYFEKYIKKEPLASFKGSEYPGNPNGNKEAWKISRVGKKSAVLIEVIDSDLKLELYQYDKVINHKYKFLSFFGISISLFSTFISSDFKDFSMVTSAQWEIAYFFLTILVLILGAIYFVEYYSNRKQHSVSELVKRLQGDDKN